MTSFCLCEEASRNTPNDFLYTSLHTKSKEISSLNEQIKVLEVKLDLNKRQLNSAKLELQYEKKKNSEHLKFVQTKDIENYISWSDFKLIAESEKYHLLRYALFIFAQHKSQ